MNTSVPKRDVRRCAARNCPEAVRPSILMCRRHWFMVPADIRSRVWAAYRPGQEKVGVSAASGDYLNAVRDAVDAVAFKEAKKAEGGRP
jgi:hypothetical protein